MYSTPEFLCKKKYIYVLTLYVLLYIAIQISITTNFCHVNTGCVVLSYRLYFELFVNCLLFFSLLFSSGPPVIVGMSINIASIDSISEVNMVCNRTSSVLLKLASFVTIQLVGAKGELRP